VKSLSLELALSFLGVLRKDKTISLTVLVSVMGFFLGTAALIIVLSVGNGFLEEIRSRVLATESHLYITPYGDEVMFPRPGLEEKIRALPSVLSIFPYRRTQALVEANERHQGVVLIAYDQKTYSAKDFKESIVIVEGRFPRSTKKEILIGKELASILHSKVGEQLLLLTTKKKGAEESRPSFHYLKVSGFFKSGYWDFDSSLAFVDFDTAKSLFHPDGSINGYGLKIKDIFAAGSVKEEVQKILNYRYFVFTWAERNARLYSALKKEKLFYAIGLFFLVIIATLNILSSLLLIQETRKKALSLLLIIGTPKKLIRSTFVWMGMIISGTGIFSGAGLGVLVASYVNSILHGLEVLINKSIVFYYETAQVFQIPVSRPRLFEFLPPSIYYLEGLPSQLDAFQIGAVIFIGFFLALVASLYPPWRLSRIPPDHLLRTSGVLT